MGFEITKPLVGQGFSFEADIAVTPPGSRRRPPRFVVEPQLRFELLIAERKIAESISYREGNQEKKMRIMLLGTAAVGLVATLLTVPAYADRVCHKVCHKGFCKSECVSGGPRLYMHEGDRLNHRHEMRRPGVDVEINR